jgi:hypothetical protein
MDAQFHEDVIGVSEHVHQVGYGSALVAGNIRDPGLQQRFGNGEYAFAAKFLSFTQVELLDFFLEKPLGHFASIASVAF